MKLKIEQKHIDAGKRGLCNVCAVAKALGDVGLAGFTVQPSTRTIYDEDHIERFRLSPIDARALMKWDAGGELTPREIELEEVE